MRIVFWENIVSQHKLPYWNALAASPKVSKFVLVVEELLYEKLKKQGWENDVKESDTFELHINPSNDSITALLQEDIDTSYHVFSGIRAIPMVLNVLQLSLAYPIRRILLTESLNLIGSRAVTRRLASVFIERRYLKHYDIVLGSGANTKSWYVECGVKPANFYPFLYSIETLNASNVVEKSPTMRFLFIGQLIQRKGLDVLLQSLSKVKHSNWTLDVYGEGEDEATLSSLITDLKLTDKVNMHGVVTNKELRQRVALHDILILPSRFDGWGAVVNEALASGLKVICSSTCGASILVVNDKIGYVFPSNNTKELTKTLEQSIEEKDDMDRAYVLNYSNYLKGNYVAQYLIDILAFHYHNTNERPLPPWEKFQLDMQNKSIHQKQNH
ncbi:glycosyltransferase [Psychroserpens algicola]|uniref:Glycosyltransferase n=1 Tax=Psychroserpens algicola TaxID=1719034 RepID=A0ABT0H872_9FLAO|nr:glycosyltransferase [Psychroserpens algicola]MCK8480553.1 glycosyltransferase [Psychroserpens algicola]